MRSICWWLASVAWLSLLLAGGCKKDTTASTPAAATTGGKGTGGTNGTAGTGGTDKGTATTRKVDLRLLMPTDYTGVEVIVRVDGKEEYTGKDNEEKTIHVNVPVGQDHAVVTFFWEPNNYTKITRPRKVALKNGEIVVDGRTKNLKAEKDDIVVRFVGTPPEVGEEMCRVAKVGPNDVVYDLGCGDGRLVITAVKQFGAKKGVGIDINPDLIAKCKAAAEEAGVSKKVEFRVGDVLKVDDLPEATVVLLYMGDEITQRLQPVFQKSLKPGARIVSHRFEMGKDWPPDETRKFHSTTWNEDVAIHLWHVKK